MAEGLPEKDVDPLPGEAKSYAKGEPIPAGMPSADGSNASFASMLGIGDTREISSGLADIKRREMAATAGATGAMTAHMDKDLARIQKAYDAEGVSKDDPMLKPWNAEQEEAKYHTDPVQAFGSFASVMGILASSFTHAPLENSLNASAAAINSIKAQDDKGYDRAYKAWQDNSKLALDRHKLQHEAYEDAMSLMKTNMEAGLAKMRVQAARFGDQKTLFLLEHGMSQEVFQLQESRQKLAMNLYQNMPKLMLENFKMSTLMADPRFKLPPNDPQRMQLLHEFQQEWSGQRRTLDEQFADKWWAEHPKGSSEEFAAAASKFKRESSPYFGRASAATTLTTDRQIAQDVNGIVEQEKQRRQDAGDPMSSEEVAQFRANETRRLKTAASAVSGNRADELRGKINQVGLAETIIGHIEDMMKKHNAITGLGGKVTRPAEVVNNIFGGNETDRKQFERWVSELQEIAPRILLDSKGRPLSSEAGRVETIIAGLRFGDTTANTVRAYYEFRKVLQQIKGGLGTRLRGGSDTDAGAPPAPAAPANNDWYKNAPLVH